MLLYKQLNYPLEYACPIRTSAAHTHINKVRVLRSKCFRIEADAHCYVGKKQIHEALEIPFFADKIIALYESFDSQLADG